MSKNVVPKCLIAKRVKKLAKSNACTLLMTPRGKYSLRYASFDILKSVKIASFNISLLDSENLLRPLMIRPSLTRLKLTYINVSVNAFFDDINNSTSNFVAI